MDLHGVMSGERRGPVAMVLRGGAAVVEPGYALATRVRNGLFDRGWKRVVRAGRPVISIGNITAGGTGKTPMVAHLCRLLLEMGHRPAVLMRGYGQDEHRELAEALGGRVAIEVNADRAAGARRVLNRDHSVDVFVLDDGFQHRRLHRDLDLVLVDAMQPSGYNRLLPRGLLREPVSGLRRADAVIVTRAEAVSDVHLQELDARLRSLTGSPAAAHAAYGWACLWHGDERRSVDELAGRRVAGACGVGNPAAFERSLAQAVGPGGQVVSFDALGDHYAYSPPAVRRILDAARDAGAELLVTTGKDWVKWRQLLAARPPLPVWRAEVAVRFVRGGEAIEAMLKRCAGDG